MKCTPKRTQKMLLTGALILWEKLVEVKPEESQGLHTHTHLYPYQEPSVPQETWMNFDPDSGSPESHCVPGHRMTSGIQTGGDRQSPNCSDEQKPILTYMTIGNHTSSNPQMQKSTTRKYI